MNNIWTLEFPRYQIFLENTSLIYQKQYNIIGNIGNNFLK